MIVKQSYNTIEFEPENDFERECLQRLERDGVSSIQWEDPWNKTGVLKMNVYVHPWGQQ